MVLFTLITRTSLYESLDKKNGKDFRSHGFRKLVNTYVDMGYPEYDFPEDLMDLFENTITTNMLKRLTLDQIKNHPALTKSYIYTDVSEKEDIKEDKDEEEKKISEEKVSLRPVLEESISEPDKRRKRVINEEDHDDVSKPSDDNKRMRKRTRFKI